MPNYSSEKGPVVDTGAQRGAAKHPSEIVTYTGNSHNIIDDSFTASNANPYIIES
jgi:hypothetical protein